VAKLDVVVELTFEIAEDRSRLKLKFAGAAFIDVNLRPGHVRREQVRRKLNPAELRFEMFGERLDGSRLGEARQTFEQHVAVREQCQQEPLDDGLLADDGLHHLGL
jgi:hypothetical protein